MHILQAIRERKSDQALYETCTYLSSNNTDTLEEEWIAIIAEIGMSNTLGSSKELWIQCLNDVKTLIDVDAIDVTDALICTAKLYLLYIRTASPKSDSIAKLREKVIDHFPTGMKLSYKGVSLYEEIIPELSEKENTELFDFTHRILSGFIKLFHSKHSHTPNAVEFIARKKIVIPLKKVWPAPNPQEAAKGDPVWFVWGALLLYFPNDSYIQIAWNLFSQKWKRKNKMERLGLLIGSACCAITERSSDAGWKEEEMKIIESIAQLAPDLWAAHTPPAPTKTPKQPVPMTAEELLTDFVPRMSRQDRDIEYQDEFENDYEHQQVKVINISSVGGKK